MDDVNFCAYLAPEGFLKELLHELDGGDAIHGHLVLKKGPARPALWVENIWYNPRWIEFNSINDGAKALRDLQRNWALYSCAHHRRAQLLQEALPKVSAHPLNFLTPVPLAPMGSWTLIENNRLLASPHCSSPFGNGAVSFNENKTDPPSRAYLKLWELFTLHGFRPQKGQRVLDLGSSPGGWTWVLAELGCDVISVDKAPLEGDLMKRPNVEYANESAFAIEPTDIGPVDWLFSDIICYPERLLTLVKKWVDSTLAKNMVCTVKFQGETDHALVQQLLKIPGSRAVHLHHNKHELTWFRVV